VLRVGDRNVRVRIFDANRPLPQEVEYGQLTEPELAERCRAALHDMQSSLLAEARRQREAEGIVTHELAHDVEELLKVLRPLPASSDPTTADVLTIVEFGRRLAMGLFGKPWLQRLYGKGEQPPAWSDRTPAMPDFRYWYLHFALLATGTLYAKTTQLRPGARPPRISLSFSVRPGPRAEAGISQPFPELPWTADIAATLSTAGSMLEESHRLESRTRTIWPLPGTRGEGDIGRFDGPMAMLQMGPQEMIRNAVDYRVKNPADEPIAYGLCFDLVAGVFESRVTNVYDPNRDPAPSPKKLESLRRLVRGLDISFESDARARRFTAICRLALR
jgi:hypothetical protein